MSARLSQRPEGLLQPLNREMRMRGMPEGCSPRAEGSFKPLGCDWQAKCQILERTPLERQSSS